MKAIETPRTNKIGNVVAYISPFGQCYRAYCVPRNPNSPAQRRARGIFGSSSSGWGLKLTELQREHWDATAEQVPSHPSLEQYSHLSGQQLCVKINSTLRCVGQAPVDEPPALVVFTPNPTGDLVAVTDESGADFGVSEKPLPRTRTTTIMTQTNPSIISVDPIAPELDVTEKTANEEMVRSHRD